MTAFQDNSFQGETLFGTFYPKGYVVAAFRDRAAANNAFAALEQHGFRETRVWSGDEVLARHDEFMAQRSTLQRIGGAFGADEKVALEDYLDAARSGHVLLTVHMPSEADVEQVRTVIAGDDARLMHYYGALGMADLSDQGVRSSETLPTTGKVHEPSGPPPASPDQAQRDPAW
jgi:2-polyprenyl-6-methoxyphenol hydroxylase-like FAD-dependent oxidoreductase